MERNRAVSKGAPASPPPEREREPPEVRDDERDPSLDLPGLDRLVRPRVGDRVVALGLDPAVLQAPHDPEHPERSG